MRVTFAVAALVAVAAAAGQTVTQIGDGQIQAPPYGASSAAAVPSSAAPVPVAPAPSSAAPKPSAPAVSSKAPVPAPAPSASAKASTGGVPSASAASSAAAGATSSSARPVYTGAAVAMDAKTGLIGAAAAGVLAFLA